MMGKEFWLKCCSDSKQRTEVKMEGKKSSSGLSFHCLLYKASSLRLTNWLTAHLHDYYSVPSLCGILWKQSTSSLMCPISTFCFNRKYVNRGKKTRLINWCIYSNSIETVKTITFKSVKKYEHGLYMARCITN